MWLNIHDLAWIKGNELVGLSDIWLSYEKEFKTYCKLLNQHLIESLEFISFVKLRYPIVLQYEASIHVSKYTQWWLVHTSGTAEKAYEGWPANTYLLNPNEIAWIVIKKEIFEVGKPFNSE